MRVLYVQPGPGVGGSKISLRHILQCAPAAQVSQAALTLPPDPGYEHSITNFVEKVHYLELPTWNKYRRNRWSEKIKAPFSHARRLLSVFPAVSRLTRIIKEERIDLVHTNNGICPAGSFAAALAGVPHVWHIREAIGTVFPLLLGNWLTAKIIHRFSDVIICNSQFTAAFLNQYGYQVEIVMNGIDLQSFRDAEIRGRNLRQRLSGRDEDPLVAMVGNLTTLMKKHDLFLEVAGRLTKDFPNCRFVVFGGSSDLSQTPYTRRLMQAANDLNLEGRVVWADFIDDIPAILHSLDILLHPASKEGSGRVVMEAMAAGQAVVGVRSGGVQELIQDGATGFLVPPDDMEAMTEKVRFLLENPRERIAMGRRAGEYAGQNFSNQVMMNAITAIYGELV